MDNEKQKILIGILYSGEREYANCLSAIRRQDGVVTEVFKIENKKNKEAHDELYSTFNNFSHHFDICAKIDADMVLKTENSLSTVAELFKSNPTLDHLMIDVADYLSDIPIPGQNFYSNRVKWYGNTDQLITDYHGTYQGTSRRIMSDPIARHMPNPSGFQAFSFGVHRALKIVQPTNRHLDFGRALLHWTVISRIYECYQRLGDVRRLFALAGVQEVIDSIAPNALLDYRSTKIQQIFDSRWRHMDSAIKNQLLEEWKSPLKITSKLLYRR